MTPTTIEELDEMRARILCTYDGHIWPNENSCNGRIAIKRYLKSARAIREADEAAGLVVVPVEATKLMCDEAGAVNERPTSGYIARVLSAAIAASPFAVEKMRLVEALEREYLAALGLEDKP